MDLKEPSDEIKKRLSRAKSTFDFHKPFEQQSLLPWSKSVLSGSEVLRNPHYNKGLGFTWEERRDLNIHGLLPPCYRSLETQSRQVMLNIKRMTNDLDKYMYLMGILDSNEKLFYRALAENLSTLMPIVYTPTVGLACQKFGHIFTNTRVVLKMILQGNVRTLAMSKTERRDGKCIYSIYMTQSGEKQTNKGNVDNNQRPWKNLPNAEALA
ncbi:NADP-dependent malic enzyme [Reticulomyxa filosa]|uniref:NADP-dependent malic enzyme n=1 Tax=Reticulomyxa filosa TaxID=46433 RepID=X6M4L1_RETFI|nr:NADP-dependent malic enzyme [Reticulomyxa filosa]|eukprot:ETO08586.1 NADP-dependent malic enzyme [Reticulomyxa filosa]